MPRTLPLLLMLVAAPALAQREPPDAPHIPDDGGPPRVYYAHSYQADAWQQAGLGDRISLHVQNFGKVLERTHDTCNGVVLFIEGMPIRGLKPESCDREDGHVRYLLMRSEQSDATWRTLLGKPRGYKKTIGVSLGADDQFSIPSDVNDFQFVVLPRGLLWCFIAVSLVGLAVFARVSMRTGLIRNRSGSLSVVERPYSLARFQMAFWFYMVVTAYVFIWLISGELDTITDSVLALLGVGTGTALGASLIESSGRRTDAGATTDRGQAAKSRGFTRDVLDDGDTLSLPRFQLFVWTLVLGVIFCRSVYDSLQMPEFSATLLGLMGISSGTYLGFKTQEGPESAVVQGNLAPGAAPAVTPATDAPATAAAPKGEVDKS